MAGSIFSVLREQREHENTMSEENKGTQIPETDPKLNEGTENPETPKTEEPKETPKNEGTETPKTEEPENDDTSEEVTVVACPHCGILETLNESGETELDACPHCGEEDLIERVVKVVRDGEVVKKKVKTKKTRLTAAQKQALAKARKKAHTATAEKSRKKSNKVRNKKGLNDADYVECPECGWSGDEDMLLNGCCPDCGAHICKPGDGCGKNEAVSSVMEAIANMSDEDLKALKEALKGE